MTNLVQFPALGLEMNINRVAFSIGGFEIYWYGLLIGSGMLLALVFAFSVCKSFGVDDNRLVDVVFLTTIMAVICARVYYVAFAPFKYESFWDMINLRDGGIAIYGAVLGAAVFGFLFCKLRKIPVLPTFDITAMGFLIGQGIGRWGNFFNQEAFGSNTNSIFGMYSPSTYDYLNAVKDTLAAEGVIVDPSMPVHPTFLYESVWCLLGFVLLALHIKKRRFDGEIAIFYAIWYGFGRFFIEGLRTDSLMTGFLNLRVSQIVAAVSVIGGIILWIILKKRNIGVTPPILKENAAEQQPKAPQELEDANTEAVISADMNAHDDQNAVQEPKNSSIESSEAPLNNSAGETENTIPEDNDGSDNQR